MLELQIKKEALLTPLLMVAGALDKKQALSLLSHFLFEVKENGLQISATDLEITICANVACSVQGEAASFAVPAKKLIDIIKSLDENGSPVLCFDSGLLRIKQGRSAFKLATLSAETYPLCQEACNEIELTLPKTALLQLLQSTHFAMSQQDVRFFLNGLFIECEPQHLVAVGSDGHRMAICRFACDNTVSKKILLPRKGVQELLRVLHHISDEQVLIAAGESHFKLTSQNLYFYSNLIEAKFPPYVRAIPRDNDKHILVDCLALKRSLMRMIILANEKSKGVLLHLQAGQLTLIANNQEQEEATEIIEAQTHGEELTIGLNASYLIDVLTHFGEGPIRLSMSNTDSSILVESLADENYQYVLMPMKI